jgi:hypothetical protein
LITKDIFDARPAGAGSKGTVRQPIVPVSVAEVTARLFDAKTEV